jgi:hypothetical protein
VAGGKWMSEQPRNGAGMAKVLGGSHKTQQSHCHVFAGCSCTVDTVYASCCNLSTLHAGVH